MHVPVKRWFAILVLYAIAGLVALHVILPDSGKKDVDFGAAIVSGAAIVYSVLLSVQTHRLSVRTHQLAIFHRRTGSSARFMERWNGADFTGARRDVRDAIRRETIEYVQEGHIVMMLNFFEEMSLSIQSSESDEPMLRRYFKSVVLMGNKTFGPWIEQQRELYPNAFDEFRWLVKLWKNPDEG